MTMVQYSFIQTLLHIHPTPLLLCTLFSTPHNLCPPLFCAPHPFLHLLSSICCYLQPQVFKRINILQSFDVCSHMQMQLTCICIPITPHICTLIYIHSQLSSVEYSTKLTQKSTQLHLRVSSVTIALSYANSSWFISN